MNFYWSHAIPLQKLSNERSYKFSWISTLTEVISIIILRIRIISAIMNFYWSHAIPLQKLSNVRSYKFIWILSQAEVIYKHLKVAWWPRLVMEKTEIITGDMIGSLLFKDTVTLETHIQYIAYIFFTLIFFPHQIIFSESQINSLSNDINYLLQWTLDITNPEGTHKKVRYIESSLYRKFSTTKKIPMGKTSYYIRKEKTGQKCY